MSRTQSTMVTLGAVAPAFELRDVVSGKAVGRDDVFAGADAAGRHGLLAMFICVHCPYVKHVEEELARIGRDYEGKIGIAAISSNDIAAYPEDGPEGMKAQALRLGNALKEAGIPVTLFGGRDTTHGKINADLDKSILEAIEAVDRKFVK